MSCFRGSKGSLSDSDGAGRVRDRRAKCRDDVRPNQECAARLVALGDADRFRTGPVAGHDAGRQDDRWRAMVFTWLRNRTTGIALMIVIVGMLASRRVHFAMILAHFCDDDVPAGNWHSRIFQESRGSQRYAPAGGVHPRPPSDCGNVQPSPRPIRNGPSDLSIYLNRATVLVPDPATLPQPTDRPQIYVQLQRRNEPEPKPSPGWTYLHKVRRDRDWYHAFVRTPGLAGE